MILAYSLLEEVNYLQHFHHRNQLDIVRQKMHICDEGPRPLRRGALCYIATIGTMDNPSLVVRVKT
jgi:hypothetical protein